MATFLINLMEFESAEDAANYIFDGSVEEDDFDKYLDEEYDYIEICGHRYYASELFRCVDRYEYRSEFDEWAKAIEEDEKAEAIDEMELMEAGEETVIGGYRVKRLEEIMED